MKNLKLNIMANVCEGCIRTGLPKDRGQQLTLLNMTGRMNHGFYGGGKYPVQMCDCYYFMSFKDADTC